MSRRLGIQPQHRQQLKPCRVVETQRHDDEIGLERRNGAIRLVVVVDELDVVRTAVQNRFHDGECVTVGPDEQGQLAVGITRHRVGRHIGLAHS